MRPSLCRNKLRYKFILKKPSSRSPVYLKTGAHVMRLNIHQICRLRKSYWRRHERLPIAWRFWETVNPLQLSLLRVTFPAVCRSDGISVERPPTRSSFGGKICKLQYNFQNFKCLNNTVSSATASYGVLSCTVFFSTGNEPKELPMLVVSYWRWFQNYYNDTGELVDVQENRTTVILSYPRITK
jgi:hypothetical protein